MPKQNFGSGLGKNGPHRQGEKGGKGGSIGKAGISEKGPDKTNQHRGDTGERTKGNPIGARNSRTTEQGKF
jgi:hypothetical protein